VFRNILNSHECPIRIHETIVDHDEIECVPPTVRRLIQTG
jgi:hypothetical protein